MAAATEAEAAAPVAAVALCLGVLPSASKASAASDSSVGAALLGAPLTPPLLRRLLALRMLLRDCEGGAALPAIGATEAAAGTEPTAAEAGCAAAAHDSAASDAAAEVAPASIVG